MSDVSNPTSRVLDVLNFLAAHPTETFTLAEIARQVGLSNGSAHRILTTMADARVLSRNERHKTYALGIALVAIGQAAVDRHRGVETARKELARLAAELNVMCTLTTVADDDLLLLAKEGIAQSHKGLHRVGEREPMVPPIGLCHVAWSDENEIAAYIAKAVDYMSESMRRYLLDAFALIRRRGYSISAYGPAMRRIRQTMILPTDRIRDDAYWSSVQALTSELTESELQLINLEEAATDGVSYLSAPVFSPEGSVAFEVVISGMPNNLGTRDIKHYAERLCAVAAIITGEIHGQVPKI